MDKRCAILVSLLFCAAMAGAEQRAGVVFRDSVETGVIGGYRDADNFVGGMGGVFEAEIPLSRSFSLSLDADGAYNAVGGPLAGAGLDLKLGLLSAKLLDLSAIGYGRGYYQFSPQAPSYYLYGGGALLAAGFRFGALSATLGGGGSYDWYGEGAGADSPAFAPVAMASLSYALSKDSALGLAFDYGADRVFIGAFYDFGIKPYAPPKAGPDATKAAAAAPSPAAQAKKGKK